MALDLSDEERAELDAYIDSVLAAHKSGKLVTPVARGEMAGLAIMTARGKATLIGWIRSGASRVAGGV